MRNVLVVDDDVALSEILTAAIKDVCPDCRVLTATTCGTAERILNHVGARLDFVLLDYFLEDSRTCAELARNYRGSARVGIITASSVPDYHIFKTTGVSYILRKPFDLETLRDFIDGCARTA